MTYFNKNGIPISEAKEENLIGKGTNGKVYLIENNKCLKVYNEGIASKLDKDIFMLLKAYKLDNYYDLYNLIYDENKNNVGYISKYYKTSENNLLLMPIEYIIENYAKMYNSSMILANNKVITKDLYYGNIIIGDNQMTIIDADSYIFDNCDYARLRSRNLSYLAYVFVGLFQDNSSKLGIELVKNTNAFDRVKEIFYEGDLTPKTLSRKLSSYHSGIDLIRK